MPEFTSQTGTQVQNPNHHWTPEKTPQLKAESTQKLPYLPRFRSRTQNAPIRTSCSSLSWKPDRLARVPLRMTAPKAETT